MGKYDRREWQRPAQPHPERERPRKKRGGRKPWKLQARYTDESRWFPQLRDWWTRGRYATEADAQKALAAMNRPGDTLLRGRCEYRIVGPQSSAEHSEVSRHEPREGIAGVDDQNTQPTDAEQP